MSAFTGAENISFVPRKHHKTMPPFVKIVNKSNIFQINSTENYRQQNETEKLKNKKKTKRVCFVANYKTRFA